MKASLQLQPMYCSRDYNYSSRFNQQYEKPTQLFSSASDSKSIGSKITVFDIGGMRKENLHLCTTVSLSVSSYTLVENQDK